MAHCGGPACIGGGKKQPVLPKRRVGNEALSRQGAIGTNEIIVT